MFKTILKVFSWVVLFCLTIGTAVPFLLSQASTSLVFVGIGLIFVSVYALWEYAHHIFKEFVKEIDEE